MFDVRGLWGVCRGICFTILDGGWQALGMSPGKLEVRGRAPGLIQLRLCSFCCVCVCVWLVVDAPDLHSGSFSLRMFGLSVVQCPESHLLCPVFWDADLQAGRANSLKFHGFFGSEFRFRKTPVASGSLCCACWWG
jgi:hypothetical protein